MKPHTRTVLSCLGLALTAAGSICIALANGGCVGTAKPPGHVDFTAAGCLGDCPPTATAPTVPAPSPTQATGRTR